MEKRAGRETMAGSLWEMLGVWRAWAPWEQKGGQCERSGEQRGRGPGAGLIAHPTFLCLRAEIKGGAQSWGSGRRLSSLECHPSLSASHSSARFPHNWPGISNSQQQGKTVLENCKTTRVYRVCFRLIHELTTLD